MTSKKLGTIEPSINIKFNTQIKDFDTAFNLAVPFANQAFEKQMGNIKNVKVVWGIILIIEKQIPILDDNEPDPIMANTIRKTLFAAAFP